MWYRISCMLSFGGFQQNNRIFNKTTLYDACIWARLVTYSSADVAQEAIRQLDGRELDGRKLHLRLDRSHLEESGVMVFVGNLPWSTTSEELAEMLKQYKPLDVHVKTNMAGRSRGK